MPIDETSLGKIVVAETAQGDFSSIGQVVAYAGHSIAFIATGDGNQFGWAAHLCREATPAEIAVVQALTPAQNTCTHEKEYGRLTRTTTVTVCGRCRKAMSE